MCEMFRSIKRRKGLLGNLWIFILYSGFFYIVIHAFVNLHSDSLFFGKAKPVSRGVVYFGYSSNISIAQRYIGTIIRSTKAIRQHSPNLPIMLFTNADYRGVDFDYVYRIPGDLVLPGRQWWTRISLLPMTKFDQTISIDSDRVICNPIDSVFQYLSEYDMLGVSGGILPGLDNGVMVYRNSAKFRYLVKLWKEEQEKIGKDVDDQQSLSKALERLVDFRVGVLDQSWQLKYIPAEGQNWRNTTMRRSLVIHHPVKIAASTNCPNLSNSSLPRIYMGNSLRETKWKIGNSLHECNEYLEGRCSHPELDWSQRSQVTERKIYLMTHTRRKN